MTIGRSKIKEVLGLCQVKGCMSKGDVLAHFKLAVPDELNPCRNLCETHYRMLEELGYDVERLYRHTA